MGIFFPRCVTKTLIGLNSGCFWPQHCWGNGGSGAGGGGRRDEPKAEQKIVVRSRVLRNNCLEGLFHTVPSSFVLHCGRIYLSKDDERIMTAQNSNA